MKIMVKENGFWIAKRNRFKFICNLDRIYIAFYKLRFRLLILENQKVGNMQK